MRHGDRKSHDRAERCRQPLGAHGWWEGRARAAIHKKHQGRKPMKTVKVEAIYSKVSDTFEDATTFRASSIRLLTTPACTRRQAISAHASSTSDGAGP